MYYIPLEELPNLYEWSVRIYSQINDSSDIDVVNLNLKINDYLDEINKNKVASTLVDDSDSAHSDSMQSDNKNPVGSENLNNNSFYASRFDYYNGNIAAEFRDEKDSLKSQRFRYILFSILLTLILGGIYLYFFYNQFQNNCLQYKNHLLLIAVCSPIISLIIWLFWYVSHLTRLIDIYTFKANLARTLITTVEYTLKICDSEKQELATKILQDLIGSLYESPIKENVNKTSISSFLSETTKLLKEIKELVKNND